MEDTEKQIFAVIIRDSLGNIENPDWKINILNQGVPTEVIIMQLKCLLRNFTSDYFSEFNSKLTK